MSYCSKIEAYSFRMLEALQSRFDSSGESGVLPPSFLPRNVRELKNVPQAWEVTAMFAVSFNVDMNVLFFDAMLSLGWNWQVGSEVMVIFRSVDVDVRDLWKLDLTLDVSLFDLCRRLGDAAIRRREDAKGNWYAGIEIQSAGCQAQEISSRSHKKGPLAILVEEGEEEERR